MPPLPKHEHAICARFLLVLFTNARLFGADSAAQPEIDYLLRCVEGSDCRFVRAGAAKGEGCFGWVEMRDDGERISAAFTGRNHRD